MQWQTSQCLRDQMNSAGGCAVCARADQLFRCSRCRAILYCSKQHQRDHWTIHKNLCVPFAANPAGPNLLHPAPSGQTGGCWGSSSQVVTPPDVRGIHQSQYEVGRGNISAGPQHSSVLNTLNTKVDATGSFYQLPEQTMPSLNSALPRIPSSVGLSLKEQGTSSLRAPGLETAPFQHNSPEEPFIDDPMKRHTAEWILQVSQFVVDDLDKYGICVVDNFLGRERGETLLKTVQAMYDSGVFQEGEVVSSKVKACRNIRGDKITWVDGTEPETTAISYLISMVDSVVMHAKRMKTGKISQYDISGRTKAMVACYPGHGTHYVKHVDNPNRDGRCITSIYYLNKDWDIKNDGGLLRIFPEGWTNQVADIEPIFDRMLFFWSDRRNPHEVQPAFRTRYAITLWYFDAKEREEARVRHQRELIQAKKSLVDDAKK